MSTLRAKVVRLAKAHPELQEHLVPLLKGAAKTVEGSRTRAASLRTGDGGRTATLTLEDHLRHRETADTVIKVINQATRDSRGVMRELTSAEVGGRKGTLTPVSVGAGLIVDVGIRFPEGITDMDIDIVQDVVRSIWDSRLEVKGRF